MMTRTHINAQCYHCGCLVAQRAEFDWRDDLPSNLTVREACRRQVPLGGTDAQALEHALWITEKERDEARAEVERLEGVLDIAARSLRAIANGAGRRLGILYDMARIRAYAGTRATVAEDALLAATRREAKP